MKNDKLEHLFCLLVLAAALFLLCSCKSTRNIVETAVAEQHEKHTDSITVDSVFVATVEHDSGRDTTNAAADERGSIEIKRDSIGQPIRIIWHYSGLYKADKKFESEKSRWFYGLNSTRYSEAAASVDSVNEKTEEVAQEVDTRISLENIIGPGLLGLVILYLIYVFFADIVWPWIKQKRSR